MTRYLLIDPSLEQATKGVLANQFGITARNAFSMQEFQVIEICVKSITLHQIAEALRSRGIPFKAL